MPSLTMSEIARIIADHEIRLKNMEELLRRRAPDMTAPPVPELPPAPPKPEVKVKKPKRITLDLEKLGDMSKTELVQFAQRAGHPYASRLLDHDDLCGLLLGEITPSAALIDPLEGPRERTHYHVEGNKTLMASKMPCDLNCPACPLDTMLVCYHVNHDIVDDHYSKKVEGEV